MTEANVVDTSGLSCPQPVIMTRQAMQQVRQGKIVVWVDTGTSRDNVRRMAERAGWRVSVAERPEGGFELELSR
jgi:TusA-related sulfurtransferase